MARCKLAVLVWFTLAAQVWPQPASSRSIGEDPEIPAALALVEARLEAERIRRNIPGLSAVVVYDQQILWSKGFGFADVERRILATPQTIYRVASITKLFTATMLMQLRDAGKVGLEDPVIQYVPELQLRSRFADSPPITLLQLATHTSGLSREAPMDYWRTLRFPAVEAMVAALTQDGERIFPPYHEWKYSNVGYAILGLALSRAAGQPYFDYVEQNILRPLGMHDSGFHPAPGLAIGYALPEGDAPPKPVFQPDYGGYGPATSLYTHVEDIAKFISLQFRDGPAGGSQILRGSSLREMHTAHWVQPNWQGGWGIGFRITRLGPYTAIGHGGGIQGFRTDVSLIPALKLGVAVFTNTNSDPDELTAMMLELLGPVVERVQQRNQPALPPTPVEWRRYLGIYRTDFGSRVRIRLRNRRLEMVPAEEPVATPVVLTPIAPLQFRMQGGWASGESLRFEVDSQGHVTGVWIGAYPARRETAPE